MPSHDRTFLSIIGHVLFFASLLFLNNPIVFVETDVRFIIFTAMIALGTTLIFFYNRERQSTFPLRSVILIFLFILAIARINFVNSIAGTDENIQMIQPILTLITLVMSVVIANRFDVLLARNVIFIAFLIGFAPIALNIDAIFDYDQKDSFQLGVLNYDSYQSVTQIIGAMVICATSLAVSKGRSFVSRMALAALIAFGLYAVTRSPARGESIALLVAMATFFISGSRSLVILIVIGVVVPFASVLSDSTLFTRLSGILYGDFGDRDYLFTLAVLQMLENPALILTGGGINYFQIYNGLPLELYPHNFALEGFIAGGILLLIFLIIEYVAPIFNLIFYRSGHEERDFILSFMIYTVLIYFKSGTMVSMWGLTLYTCFFIRAALLMRSDSGKKRPSPKPGTA